MRGRQSSRNHVRGVTFRADYFLAKSGNGCRALATVTATRLRVQTCMGFESMERVRVVRHSIGQTRLMKFLLPPQATADELQLIFQRVAHECVAQGLRGALLVDQDRPLATQAQLKAAAAALDLEAAPPNFRLAVAAFRKSAWDAYRYALAVPGNASGRTKVFWNELDALQWLREQFPRTRRKRS